MRSNVEQLVRKSIARFVDDELRPKAQEIDEKGEFPREIFTEMAKMGVFGIRYPKERGGSGGNTTLFCIICEELARGLMSAGAATAMQCLMGTNPFRHRRHAQGILSPRDERGENRVLLSHRTGGRRRPRQREYAGHENRSWIRGQRS